MSHDEQSSVEMQGSANPETLTERIEDHQRHILTTYCETPAVLGGDPL